MNDEKSKKIAEKIALLLQESETGSDDYLRASFEKINQRLDRIESQMGFQNSSSPIAIRHPQTIHSSQEKFTNLEEIADEIINNLQTEKACPYEPTGKPCDHCAMCSSRGF